MVISFTLRTCEQLRNRGLRTDPSDGIIRGTTIWLKRAPSGNSLELRERLSEYGQRLAQLNEIVRAAQAAGFEAQASAHRIESTETPGEAMRELASARLCAELAVQADEAGDQVEDAVKLYTKAAEWYLAALRLVPDTLPDKATHCSTLTALLDRGEQLKQAPMPPAIACLPTAPPTAAPRQVAAPDATGAAPPTVPAPAAPAAPPPRVSAQLLSGEEKEVLARSSRIGGLTYYPWLADGQRERFDYSSPWEDPDGQLALSGEQRAHFGRWARPSEFMRGGPILAWHADVL